MSDIAKEQVLLAAAMSKLERMRKIEAFDPSNLESKPTVKQQEVFDDFGRIRQQWIRAGNQSGKSATCARIVSWVLTDTHPTWKRPPEWGEESLLILVAGRTGKHLEDSLLPKIRGFLEPGTYKEVRIGNMIQRLELTNGNRIVFQSLENPSTAQERLQSYVAHVVWVDELPPTMGIVRELLIRVQARNGYFMSSFTPTVIQPEIQRYVDGLQEPEGKVYRFHMLDNPLYSDPVRKTELLGRYAHLPPEQQDVIFRGEWSSAEDRVYYFNWDTMVEFPIGYSPLWRHVESVDPAIQSKLGITIWAENPDTHIWYCILAKYIKEIYIPTEIVKTTIALTRGVNIVKRIADPEASWYIQQAAAMGYNYVMARKSNRKHELIKQLQQGLGTRLRLSPEVHDLISELQGCRWSESDRDRIVNSSSYHLLDSSQYFADEIPKPEKRIEFHSWDDYIYKANEQRKLKKELVIRKINAKAARVAQRSRRWK